MRNAICLMVALFGSWSSSLGQNAPMLAYPKIVATFHRIGQTAEISPTTIYTPKNWGTFRISIVMVGTVAQGTSSDFWAGGVLFTDGKPIKVFVKSYGAEGKSTYNIWVVVEQLM
jgi:hypothetical protein